MIYRKQTIMKTRETKHIRPKGGLCHSAQGCRFGEAALG
jgi:hypothetical protein